VRRGLVWRHGGPTTRPLHGAARADAACERPIWRSWVVGAHGTHRGAGHSAAAKAYTSVHPRVVCDRCECRTAAGPSHSPGTFTRVGAAVCSMAARLAEASSRVGSMPGPGTRVYTYAPLAAWAGVAAWRAYDTSASWSSSSRRRASVPYGGSGYGRRT
jgi:hypothetical protein